MLPILRIVPVGGVLLAIMILVLALSPPGGSRRELPLTTVSARGALMKLGEHPEWRQFLMQAALQRADELSRLRDLPETPVRGDNSQTTAAPGNEAIAVPATEVEGLADVKVEAPIADKAPEPAGKAPDKIAGLPTARPDADPEPEDVTGTISETPASIPVELGETSSTELYVAPRENKPRVIKPPKRVQAPKQRRPKAVHQVRRAKSRPAAAKPHNWRAAAKPAKPQAAAPPTFFEALFGNGQSKQSSAGNAQASQPAAPR